MPTLLSLTFTLPRVALERVGVFGLGQLVVLEEERAQALEHRDRLGHGADERRVREVEHAVDVAAAPRRSSPRFSGSVKPGLLLPSLMRVLGRSL